MAIHAVIYGVILRARTDHRRAIRTAAGGFFRGWVRPWREPWVTPFFLCMICGVVNRINKHKGHRMANMPRVMSESVIGLTEACREVEKLTGSVRSYDTIYRWCVRGASGHRLECFRVGASYRTSREAVRRFIEATMVVEPVA